MPRQLTGESWITSSQKRIFDVAATTSLLPFFGPISAIGAAAFFTETGANPLFYQKRMGRNGELFRMIKLRSMPYSEDFADGSSGHNDERASRVGRVLRITRLDEVPQAAHIISGRMSIVGPRPLVESDVEKTLDLLTPEERGEWRRARSVARPGMLSDFSNLSVSIEPQTDDYLLARVENDIEYLGAASFAKDAQIITNALAIGRSLLQELKPTSRL